MQSREIQAILNHFLGEADAADFVCLLCGSAVNNRRIEELRDVDFFVYTQKGAADFYKKFIHKLKKAGIEPLHKHNDVLRIYSIKFRFNGLLLSFHIANYRYLKQLVKAKENPEIYDLDLFSWKFNIVTAYRTWIIDTEYILGNKKMLEYLKNEFTDFVIPRKSVNYIKQKLQLALQYSYELIHQNAIGEKIILMEICQLIVALVYCCNNCFFSTIKHLERDLSSFKKHRTLCSICMDLFLNKHSDPLILVKEIQELIEQSI